MACLVQIIEQLPGLGEISYQFPPDRTTEMGLLVRVEAGGDRHWIGVFGSSVSSPDAVTGMVSWPGASHFLAISRGTGYFVNCEDPENYLEIPILPVIHKLDHPSGLTILGDLCYLAAVSAAGLLWKSERLSWMAYVNSPSGARRLLDSDTIPLLIPGLNSKSICALDGTEVVPAHRRSSGSCHEISFSRPSRHD